MTFDEQSNGRRIGSNRSCNYGITSQRWMVVDIAISVGVYLVSVTRLVSRFTLRNPLLISIVDGGCKLHFNNILFSVLSSVLGYRWLGDRKGIRPIKKVKKLSVGVMVMMVI